MPSKARPTALTARAQALYENTAVPVRVIAQLCGVSERTLYKYVARGGWRRRHACPARDAAVAEANRGPHGPRPVAFAQAKGTSGRFVRWEDAGQPFASGLKALDPGGLEAALSACDEAGALANEALAMVSAARRCESLARALSLLARTVRDLATAERAIDAGPERSRRGRQKAEEAAAAQAEAEEARRKELIRELVVRMDAVSGVKRPG